MPLCGAFLRLLLGLAVPVPAMPFGVRYTLPRGKPDLVVPRRRLNQLFGAWRPPSIRLFPWPLGRSFASMPLRAATGHPFG